MPEIIKTKLISRHHDEPLAGHFRINKTRELVAQKYYLRILRHNVEAYVIGYDICLVFKAAKHNPYGYLQLLPIPTYQ